VGEERKREKQLYIVCDVVVWQMICINIYSNQRLKTLLCTQLIKQLS